MVSFQRSLVQGLFMLIVNAILAAKVKHGNNSWGKNSYKRGRGEDHNRELTIGCRKKYQLFEIEVIAGAEVLNENEACAQDITTVYGRTPDLITAVNQCYWNVTCSITFPRMKMVTCVSVNSTDSKRPAVTENDGFGACASCFWKDVSFLLPVHANCIKAKVVNSVCEFGKKGKLVCKKKLPKKKGMIKSHANFPWFYNQSYRNLSYKYRFKLSKKPLVIGLKFVDICEYDTLVIRTSERAENLTDVEENKHFTFYRKEKFADLQFIVDAETVGCGGFIICYQFVKKRADEYDGKLRHVCDDLYDKKGPSLKITTKKSSEAD